MSHYVNAFLSTELTCIPRFMDKYIGKYYSNTAGNALTWVFVMWNLLHFVFDEYLDVLLKKMQYKSYLRKRLVRALWYSGFYGTSFVYCIATILRNNSGLLEYHKSLPLDSGPIPPHVVLGLGLFGSFFLHSALWDAIKHETNLSTLSYLLLSLLPFTTYITRRIELFLALLALVSFSRFVFDILRCLSLSFKPDNTFSKFLLQGLLFTSLTVFAAVHILLVPILLVIPLVFGVSRNNASFGLVLLILVMISWWITEIFSNPLYKFIFHWLYHPNLVDKKFCPGSMLECSLFSPRDDVAFTLSIIRKEIKERQERMISKRKPKNRGVLIQTLKCMVAIRRKLNKKRNSESSESDSEEKAERESEESSSEENSDVEDEETRQYKEETARALLEDREEYVEAVDDKKND